MAVLPADPMARAGLLTDQAVWAKVPEDRTARAVLLGDRTAVAGLPAKKMTRVDLKTGLPAEIMVRARLPAGLCKLTRQQEPGSRPIGRHGSGYQRT